MKEKGAIKVVSRNKKANHDYFIFDTYECGIVLTGTEIKSIRLGKVNIADAYCRVKNNEMIIENMHISKYEQGNIFNHVEVRDRKLLLHAKEIRKLTGKITLEGYTLIPLEVYLKEGLAKVLIGVAKGKKNYDKRSSMKEEDLKRQARR